MFAYEYSEISKRIDYNFSSFKFFLIALCLLSIVLLPISIYLYKGDIVHYWYLLSLKISIVFPIIWYLVILSRNLKEDKLLAQSYLHKKVLAQSYLSYANTINSKMTYGDDEVKKQMMKLLLKSSIEVLKDNPVSILDKKTINEDSIVLKLLDKVPFDKK